MHFTHPAARGAKVWPTKLNNGEVKNILIIITNAELNKDKKKYNADIIAQLVAAAEEWLQGNVGIDGYVLANRPRDWENSKDG